MGVFADPGSPDLQDSWLTVVGGRIVYSDLH
jgi:hypothetical protein